MVGSGASVIYICGPSGSGKTALVKRLVGSRPDFVVFDNYGQSREEEVLRLIANPGGVNCIILISNERPEDADVGFVMDDIFDFSWDAEPGFAERRIRNLLGKTAH